MTDSENKLLQHRHAVVIGGGRGIGAACARRLASKGATVTVMGRNKERMRELCEESGRQFQCVTVDVTKPDSVAVAFDQARKLSGDPYILVNSAGGVDTAPFARTTPELWREMIDLNLTGVYFACQEVIPAMTRAESGRIVNVASTAGVRGYPYVSAYTAAKHGAVGLTKSLALETATKGVTVNAVCPGYTDTDLLTESAQKVADKTGSSVDRVLEAFKKANRQRRFVETHEVASAVAWLCMPEQRSVTGQTLLIDGGETL